MILDPWQDLCSILGMSKHVLVNYWQWAKFRGSWDLPDAINRTQPACGIYGMSGMPGMWRIKPLFVNVPLD